jgi:hypothetical protein
MDILVAKVLDKFSVVINKGEKDGIKRGYQFLIYSEYGEIFDPETNKSLGNLEVPKGFAEVESLQERITLLRSSEFRNKSTRIGSAFFHSAISGFNEESEKVRVPFSRDVSIGDKVKLVR